MVDFKKELNPDQYAAVTSSGDRVLVLAGAGSGKTRTLTYRVAWLLEQGVKPWEILLLTFTNKAANEMLSRVESLTGVSRRSVWGGTFHSVALRILRTHSEEAGLKENFTILDADDAEKLFAGIIKKLSPETFKGGRRSVKPAVFFNALSYMRNTRIGYDETRKIFFDWLGSEGTRILEDSHKIYTEEKARQNVIDFDDILDLSVRLFQGFRDVREFYHKKFKYLLVDEFQDTNVVQAELIDLLAGTETRLMVVGDDAQCIYTWRGASYDNIVRFPDDHAGTQVFKVEINYRSTPEILAFANSILEARRESHSFAKELRPVREHQEKPLLVSVLNAFDQGDYVAQRIRSLIEDRGVSPGDIAVLYRSHSHAKEVQMSLSKLHLPFVVTSGVQFFEQAHVRDFLAILRFLTNPYDAVAFQRVTTLLERLGPATAQRILKKASALATKEKHHLFYELLNEAVLKIVPAPALDDFKDFVLTLHNMYEGLTGTKIEAAAMPDADPVPANEEADLFALADEAAGTDGEGVQEIMEPRMVVAIGIEGWYGDFAKRIYPNWRERCDDLNSLIDFASNYETLADFLAQVSLMDSGNTRSDIESRERDFEEPKVRLSTIHQAKGLEFPYVFVLSCSDELFPSKRSLEEDTVDEERRLFYVACTRAKDELTLVYILECPRFSDQMTYELSRFVREANPETYQRLGQIVHYSHDFGGGKSYNYRNWDGIDEDGGDPF
ncbi:MAG: ATP-dependent helicase [Opitutales bacterium]|nr:ATP-dependent helicase [Opitutales bacterium]